MSIHNPYSWSRGHEGRMISLMPTCGRWIVNTKVGRSKHGHKQHKFKPCFLLGRMIDKVCGPYLVIHHYWAPILDWYIARPIVENEHQKDMCCNELGLMCP